MAITIDSLTKELKVLEQQRSAAANMAQQCAGAISVLQKQLSMLQKEREEELRKEQEAKEKADGKADNEAKEEAA